MIQIARLAVIAAFVSGCGGAASEIPAEEPAGAPDVAGGNDAASQLLAEEIESGYPCDLAARAWEATPLDGPHDSIEGFAAKAGTAPLSPLGPTLEYGAQGAVFTRGMIVAAGEGDGGVFAAVERGGKWFFSKNLARAGEIAAHEGPIFTERGESFPDRMMVVLDFDGPEDGEVRGRSVTLTCSTGESGIPSCLQFPESFDLAGDEGPVTARLRTLPCDDGTIVIYGNPTLLPDELEADARELMGRRIPVFP